MPVRVLAWLQPHERLMISGALASHGNTLLHRNGNGHNSWHTGPPPDGDQYRPLPVGSMRTMRWLTERGLFTWAVPRLKAVDPVRLREDPTQWESGKLTPAGVLNGCHATVIDYPWCLGCDRRGDVEVVVTSEEGPMIGCVRCDAMFDPRLVAEQLVHELLVQHDVSTRPRIRE